MFLTATLPLWQVCPMQLASYLKTLKITDAEFARMIGVNQSTVLRLKRRERRPSLELAQRIFKATGGKVPPTAWFSAEAAQ